jgi:short-subunit dehydrogenase
MNKNAVIIGGTSGIGRELVKILVQNNWKVGVTGRRKKLLDEIKKENPENIFIAEHDIILLDQSNGILQKLFSNFDGVSMVIVSSGISELNQKLDWAIEKNVIETNVNGVAKIYEFVFNHFRAQKFGHLVGISSIAAIRGNRHCPSYSASKAFQSNYLEALRCISKNEKLNIVVTDIQPGFVDTAMAKGENIFWITSAEKAARQIYKAVLQKARKRYISKRWKAIAIITKIMPGWLLEKL